ncbi:MAG: DNA polymerase III subunit beta [Halobacteriovoraceae bacterium]|nr:DNA polymerase III subunit beta [Halobacteriovoraceae bacterium]
MEFEISSKDLKESLGKIVSVSDKKQQFSNPFECLFAVKSDELEMLSTDNEIFSKVRIKINKTNGSDFSFLINSKNLFDIVKELSEEKIFFNLNNDENTLTLSTENSFYKLLTYQNENFNFCHIPKEVNFLSISKSKFLQMLNLTSYAVSNDETRIYLNGLYLQEVNGNIRIVATDGHRLSMLESNYNGDENQFLANGVILPKKGIQELKRISEVKNNEDDLKLFFDDTFIYVQNGKEYELTIRQISRDYPKYQAVIPQSTKNTLIAVKSPLFEAVKRIKVMSNEKSNQVRFKLDSNKIELSANHPSLGKAKEVVPVHYNGDPLEIGFNAKYLIDALGALESDEISFELNNELSPVVLKSPDKPDYLGIIMPLKL